ncbi:hypothetical protein L4C34_18345 [Vibrio profundum]|uniref:hypothetical protein n=1 Tax=Vibrio profundum TaxID=2910247 RepID=UPI003D11E78F
MTQRNIHGNWTMTFEDGLLCSKIKGATNKEASQAWFGEMAHIVDSYQANEPIPWAALIDARDWEMASMDMWEANNELVDWMEKHNCVLFLFILAKKMQKFAIETQIDSLEIIRFSFDYAQAYQTCQAKLKEAQRTK